MVTFGTQSAEITDGPDRSLKSFRKTEMSVSGSLNRHNLGAVTNRR